MTVRYTIGGTAFLVDEPLADLETDTFADAELKASFVSTGDFESRIAREHGTVAGPGGLEGAIDRASMRCWMPAPEDSADRGWYLRQMAPVFGATLERLVLHASAVRIGHGVVAFVGASGAGKSTIAQFFAERGYQLVSDDLLPVRFEPKPGAPAYGRMYPLSAVFLIERTASRTVEATVLDRATALRRLITHGFGEHGDRSAWAFQFDAYHRIVEAATTYDLSIPDDLSALPAVLSSVIELAPTSAPPDTATGTG